MSSQFELLTVDNPKIAKGEKFGYLTAILHLAPSDLSGFNVCPMVLPAMGNTIPDGVRSDCSRACLNTAGRGGMAKGVARLDLDMIRAGSSNTIQKARIRRTRLYFTARAEFMAALARDIVRLERLAAKFDLLPAVRLNGTSDVPFERVATLDHASIMEAFPHIPFYDYTKIASRLYAPRPANYHLTLSLLEHNAQEATRALRSGHSVAIVFRDKTTRARYMVDGCGYDRARVIDGDETDLRFTDPQSVVVGLYAKGNAKRDTSGFVQD